jgi:hypothetical protein
MRINIPKHADQLKSIIDKIEYLFEYKVSGKYRYTLKIFNGIIKDIEDGPESRNSRIIQPKTFFSILRFYPEEYEKFVDRYLK